MWSGMYIVFIPYITLQTISHNRQKHRMLDPHRSFVTVGHLELKKHCETRQSAKPISCTKYHEQNTLLGFISLSLIM